MKILVVGSGGREHALCWKIAQSPLVDKVFCAPGNAGIAGVAECVDLAVDDIEGLVQFAKDQAIELTVVGPEGPLCAGIVDAFASAELEAFGPNKLAAEVEGSKKFAREMCRRHRIPSPAFWTFDDAAQAKAFLDHQEDGPIVVKASGLAAGKGVTVAKNRKEARAAVEIAMDQSTFGDAGNTIVFEEFLSGSELSIMVLTDGSTIIPFEPARDHKAVHDGGKGPNTGGMGAFSPVPGLQSRTSRQIETQILFPSVHALNRENRNYRGFLYAGLMLTPAGPRTLEFNCRLGDPETQPLLMRLKSDLVPYLLHAVRGTLDTMEAPEWHSDSAVCVMATAPGYPGDYPKDLPIHGLDDDGTLKGMDPATCQVFHSGTRRRKDNGLVTSGGRVLAVCGLGPSLESARDLAYEGLGTLEFEGMHYRRDIAGLGARRMADLKASE